MKEQQRQQQQQEERQQMKQKIKEMLMTRPQKQLLIVAMSRVKEAMTLLEEQRGDHGLLHLLDALEIVESIRGTYHGETAKLYVAMAGTLQSLDKNPRAKQSYQKAIDIYHVIDRENQDQLSGGSMYSKRYIQAWIGLGTTYTSLEKWHEAMKAFQSAARLEMYNLLVTASSKTRPSGKADHQKSLTMQRENLRSVQHLRALITSIETNHSNNRKQVWSRFPYLPKEISLYLDALQATVQYEVHGDYLYHQGKLEASQREYQMAQVIFQQQVHTSQHSGISLDAIWLLRKQAVVELRVVESHHHRQQGGGDEKNPLEMIPLNQLVRSGVQPHCVGFEKACQALVNADSLLREARFDPEQFSKAYYRLEEARVLTKLYHTIPTTRGLGVDGPGSKTEPPPQPQGSTSQSIVQDMKRTLEELRQQLVPEGLSPSSEQTIKVNTKLVWQELQQLSILVEAEESLLSTTTPQPLPQSCHSPSSPLPPVGVCDASNRISSIPPTNNMSPLGMGFFLVLVLTLVLVGPMFLVRKTILGQGQGPDKDPNNKMISMDDGTKGEQSTSRLDPQEGPGVSSDQSQTDSQPETSSRIHVIPPCLAGKESKSTSTTSTTGSNNHATKAIEMLQCLDRVEAELQGMSFLRDTNTNTNAELVGNKVSALVCLQKTRQALLARVMGEVEDDDDNDDVNKNTDDDDAENSVDINKKSGLEMDIEFQTFIDRMQELGFESLVANLVPTSGTP